jgi:hypothetical protein
MDLVQTIFTQLRSDIEQKLAAAEKQIEQREQQRQRRAAGQGVLEQQYFDRMKQLVLTDRG